MSAFTTTLTTIFRIAIVIAALSALSLATVLVLYFMHVAIPPAVMGLGIFGLPVAFILAGAVVVGNIIQRRNS